MSETALLEPSFADAIAAIAKAPDLSPSRRMHWICSLGQIAKALNRPTASVPARWGAVAPKVNQLHHVPNGVERKTLANHKSNTKTALLWFRKESVVPVRGCALTDEWRRLRRQLTDRSRLAKLSGLIRYGSLKGIVPVAVDEAVLNDYMRYRAENTGLRADTKARRAIARAWNASLGHRGWPKHRLVEPPLAARSGPHWEDFPVQLQHEVDGHLASLAKPRRGPSGKRLQPCRPSTIRSRRTELVGFAKKAVRLGVPIEQLSSLATRQLGQIMRKQLIDSEP